jgi:hypothetical protein
LLDCITYVGCKVDVEGCIGGAAGDVVAEDVCWLRLRVEILYAWWPRTCAEAAGDATRRCCGGIQ